MTRDELIGEVVGLISEDEDLENAVPIYLHMQNLQLSCLTLQGSLLTESNVASVQVCKTHLKHITRLMKKLYDE